MSVVKTKVNTLGSSMLKEHWTSQTEQEILDLFEKAKINYPVQGYGTMLSSVKQDPTGLLWHAEFSRFNSCD